MNKIPVYFHKQQLLFKPKYEWALGKRIKHAETTRRAESIYNAIKAEKDYFDLIEPERLPLSAIRECINYQLITLYNTASLLEDGHTFYPNVFPQRAKAEPDPTNINHAGFYCFDSGTPLNNKTWLAASWSAASAYYAAMEVYQGRSPVAYALSRPPGHHASRDIYGGYCYINNAALAAKLLRKKGRIVVLDIDFHHGNGTQEIFYRDDQVLVINIHGDPRLYFPWYHGFPSEVGAGEGEGTNLNITLPGGTDYASYSKILIAHAIPAIKRFEPIALVLSVGFDTYQDDPVGDFKFNTADYGKLGKLLSELNYPTVIVQEGGYYTQDLGENAVTFLKPFAR